MNGLSPSTVWTNAHRRSHFSPAFLFLGQKQREALKRLYAVCRVVDDAVDVGCEDPETFLSDWVRVFTTKDPSVVQRYGQDTLAKEFLSAAEEFQIPLDVMVELIEKGVSVDLHRNRFGTPMETESYCYGVAGTVGIACLPIFGVPVQEAKDFAVRLGIAIQWINLIRDVGVDSRLGRIYLPLDHLEQFGYTPDDLIAHKNGAGFQALMKHEVSLARSHFKRAMELMPIKWKKELLPARIMARIYLKLLDKIEKKNFPVFQEKIQLNALEKFWTAWQTVKEHSVNN
jgi:15-cis-phytoene synthase